MSEFIDGWGRPIRFLRWAPGYLPPSAYSSAKTAQAAATDLQTGDPDNDHDPFDPLRTDVQLNGGPPRGYRLAPLIYSAGSDGETDIWAKNKITAANSADLIDPYYTPAVTDGLPAGTPMIKENTQNFAPDDQGEGRFMDNITNHALGVR